MLPQPDGEKETGIGGRIQVAVIAGEGELFAGPDFIFLFRFDVSTESAGFNFASEKGSLFAFLFQTTAADLHLQVAGELVRTGLSRFGRQAFIGLEKRLFRLCFSGQLFGVVAIVWLVVGMDHGFSRITFYNGIISGGAVLK